MRLLSTLLHPPIASVKGTVYVFWNALIAAKVTLSSCSVCPAELNVHRMHLLRLPDMMRRLTRGVEDFSVLSLQRLCVEQFLPRIFSKPL